MWVNIAKWVVTAVLLPIINKMVEAYFRLRNKVKSIKRKGKVNEQSAQAYSDSPGADTFSKLP